MTRPLPGLSQLQVILWLLDVILTKGAQNHPSNTPQAAREPLANCLSPVSVSCSSSICSFLHPPIVFRAPQNGTVKHQENWNCQGGFPTNCIERRGQHVFCLHIRRKTEQRPTSKSSTKACLCWLPGISPRVVTRPIRWSSPPSALLAPVSQPVASGKAWAPRATWPCSSGPPRSLQLRSP